jgi:hypothetical protein
VPGGLRTSTLPLGSISDSNDVKPLRNTTTKKIKKNAVPMFKINALAFRRKRSSQAKIDFSTFINHSSDTKGATMDYQAQIY